MLFEATLEQPTGRLLMAHEITPWKELNCSFPVNVNRLSERDTFSREINEKFCEGGALNANYRIVDAIAVAVDMFRDLGFKYNVDYVFKTVVGDEIFFDFKDKGTRDRAEVTHLHVLKRLAKGS